MGEVTPHPRSRGAVVITAPAPIDPNLHDTTTFDCGKPSLNDWLRQQATKSDGKTARTFVVCENSRVIGYYCIFAGSIERSAVPKEIKEHGLPRSIPVVVIGRLARDESYKGQGLGPDLLSDALKRILAASNTIGVRGVLVHALDDDSVPFYEKNGFLPCPTIDERTFFLPLETIKAGL
jgi:GNAT superfamily N-acetyltransferase